MKAESMGAILNWSLDNRWRKIVSEATLSTWFSAKVTGTVFFTMIPSISMPETLPSWPEVCLELRESSRCIPKRSALFSDLHIAQLVVESIVYQMIPEVLPRGVLDSNWDWRTLWILHHYVWPNLTSSCSTFSEMRCVVCGSIVVFVRVETWFLDQLLPWKWIMRVILRFRPSINPFDVKLVL